MVPADSGGAVSVGIDLLLLGTDGRIRIAYQFIEPGPPPSNQHQAVVERYVDFWSRPSAEKCAALWAEDGAYIREGRERRGHGAIETEAKEAHRNYVANGVDGHHDVVRFIWDVQPRDGGPVAASGSNLLILDDDGRVASPISSTTERRKSAPAASSSERAAWQCHTRVTSES
jgi:hypothetical protein